MNCTECGAEFVPAPRKLTCSPECAERRRRRIRGEKQGGRRDSDGFLLGECEICRRDFRVTRGKKCCSQKCDSERRRARQREFKRREYQQNPELQRQLQRERRRRNAEHYRAKERERWKRRRNQPIAICNRCGKQFPAKRKDSAYCSEECRSPIVTIECACCGIQFQGTRRSKYCSDKCSQQWFAEQERIKRRATDLSELQLASLAINSPATVGGRYIYNCEICGSEFRSDSHHANYCGEECRKESIRRSYRERSKQQPKPRKLTEHSCVICNRQFMGRVNAKTCSAECRAEHKRRVMRELKEADPEGFRERQKELQRKRHGINANCIVCGKDMSSLPNLRTNRYTCSPECRAEAYRRKQRRNYERRIGRSKAKPAGPDKRDN